MSFVDSLTKVVLRGVELVGASFRGVPFLVERSERGGGRRVVVHEFPQRDNPFVEDLGRRARTFKIDGYVIGSDYVAQRDALMAALEDVAGPGELVHPYHRLRRAVCVNVSVSETRADGGMATFAIEFAEAPTQVPVPTVVADAPTVVAAKATTAKAATKAELAQRFNPVGLPAFALASAETALRRASDAMGSFVAPVVTSTQELAELTGKLHVITATASSLVRQPDGIIDAFTDALASFASAAVSAPGAVVDALLETYAAGLGDPPAPTTLTRAREAGNHVALTGALRQVFATEAARLVPTVPYASIEDATAARDRVAAVLEEQAAIAGDTAYPELVSLRSEVLRSVPGSSVFARVIDVQRSTAVPSLLLAYQLYGSVDQEADVIARNRIAHPGFIAGALKVLSDGR